MLSHLCPQELCRSQPVSRTPTRRRERGKQAFCCRRFFVLRFIKSETVSLVLSASTRAGPSWAWAGVRAPPSHPLIPTRYPGCGALSRGHREGHYLVVGYDDASMSKRLLFHLVKF